MTTRVWCESVVGSVSDELAELSVSQRTAFGLVRSWDSEREPERIVAALARLGVPSTLLSSGALVDLRDAGVEALACACFGFDEVWVGCDATDWSALSEIPPLTSDRVNLSADDCAPYRKGLLRSGAQLALADGVGLNIVRVLAED